MEALDTRHWMETDDNSSGALGAGEHGGGSHQLQSPGSNPLGVGQGGNAAEGYVAKYAAKEDTKVNRSLSAAEGYVAKYAAKEDTKMNRSLSGREMLNWPSLQSFPADLAEKGFFALQNKEKKLGKWPALAPGPL